MITRSPGKSLLAIASALLLLVPVFSFAGGQQEEDDVVTLEVMLPTGGGYTIEGQEAIGEAFSEANPDINIDMEFVGWDALFDRIVTSIGSGNPPDAMYVGSRWIPQLANMGALTPLEQYLSDEKIAMYPDAVWDTTRYEGDIYGVVRAMSSKAIIYNRTLFEEAGLDPDDPPTSWEEIYQYAAAIQELGPDTYGYGLAGDDFTSTAAQFMNYLFANGGRVIDEDGNIVFDQEPAVEALEFYAEYLPDVTWSAPMEWRREDIVEPFSQGHVGMFIDHVHAVEQALDAGIDVGVALIPGGPHADAPDHAAVQVTDSIVIPAQSENPEAALEFIDFMTGYEQQVQFDIELGFVPPIEEAWEEEEFQQWYWQPYLEATREYAVGQPSLTNYTAGEEQLIEAIQSVLLGNETPQEAADSTARTIRSLEGGG